MLSANKIILVFILFLFVSINTFSQSPVLPELIREAVENSSKIKEAYHQWQAANEKVKVVKGFADPVVKYTYFDEHVETRVGPQDRKYGVSQKIPFPGKLRLRAKAQRKLAESLKQRYEALTREVIREVKQTFYDIFWVDKAVSIIEEEKLILESQESVAQRKYESNKTSQQDVIKAQVELTRLIDKLYFLKQNRNSLVSKMQSLLGREEPSSFDEIVNIEKTVMELSLEELENMSEKNSQRLVSANLEVKKAEHEKTLAKTGYLPDFTFGFERIEIGAGSTTQPEDGKDAVMGTISFTVPLWVNRIAAEVKEKDSLLLVAKSKQKNVKDYLKYEVEDAFYKLSSYQDIIVLYETALMPQVQQSYDAAKTSYETGNSDFLNWLDAERLLLQTRLAYYKNIVDYNKTKAYLEEIIGKDL